MPLPSASPNPPIVRITLGVAAYSLSKTTHAPVPFRSITPSTVKFTFAFESCAVAFEEFVTTILPFTWKSPNLSSYPSLIRTPNHASVPFLSVVIFQSPPTLIFEFSHKNICAVLSSLGALDAAFIFKFQSSAIFKDLDPPIVSISSLQALKSKTDWFRLRQFNMLSRVPVTMVSSVP